MSDGAVHKLAEALAVILKGDQSPPETPAAPATPPPTPAAPPTPAPPEVPAAIAAAASALPTPPPGRPALESLDQWEALPQAERIRRMDEADALYLRENGGS